MSPCASASATSTTVTAERSATAPPSSSGTPSMVRPSSAAWSSSSPGAPRRPRRRPAAAGRSSLAANSRNASRSICCSSVGVRSNSPLLEAGESRAGRPSLVAAVNVRPAAPAARKPLRLVAVDDALRRLAQAQPVDDVEAREAVQGAQAEAHAAICHVHTWTYLTRQSYAGRAGAHAALRPRRSGRARSLVEPCSLDGRRRHLCEMDERGLVLGAEASIHLVEELEGAERCAVEGGQGHGQPSS